jgi:hypothetical protein
MLLFRVTSLAVLGLTAATALASAQATDQGPLPPAPILLRWPEPAFEPERQCQRELAVQDLARFLRRARLAMWLPSTRRVQHNEARGCITVTVDDIGTGRLVELLLRGVAVPRSAVLLQLTHQTGA